MKIDARWLKLRLMLDCAVFIGFYHITSDLEPTSVPFL